MIEEEKKGGVEYASLCNKKFVPAKMNYQTVGAEALALANRQKLGALQRNRQDSMQLEFSHANIVMRMNQMKNVLSRGQIIDTRLMQRSIGDA